MIDEFAQAAQTHKSPAGRTHIGSREFCVSIDCAPPLLPVREGDIIGLAGPGVGGVARITSSRADDGMVTLHVEYVAPYRDGAPPR